MTDLDLIVLDAVACPKCERASGLKPVYRCTNRWPRSDVLIGLACTRCWPSEVASSQECDEWLNRSDLGGPSRASAARRMHIV
jgi:hypothetical protein